MKIVIAMRAIIILIIIYSHVVLNDRGLPRLTAKLIYTKLARRYFYITRIGKVV